MSDDLSAKISSWLTDTGYPLEMRSLRTLSDALQDTEWRLIPNEYHTDLETGLSREVDLELHWMDGLGSLPESQVPVSIEFQILIECKTSDHPWVILKHGPKDSRSWSHRAPMADINYLKSPIRWIHRQPSTSVERLINELCKYMSQRLPTYSPPGYAIMDGLARTGGRNASYDAVRQAVSSCVNAAGTVYLSYNSTAISWYFPVVLTTARLFEATLDASADAVAVTEVERTSLLVPIPGEALTCSVAVLRPSALSSLVDDLKTLPEIVSSFLSTADPALLNNSWEEAFIIEGWPRILTRRRTLYVDGLEG